MELAKPALDVGLYTNNLESMLAFWEHHAHYDELLKLGGGAHQHRHSIGDSILKVNHSREPTPAGDPTGIRTLTLYSPAHTTTQTTTDPDGNALVLAPTREQFNLSLGLVSNDVQRSAGFYAEAMTLPVMANENSGFEFQIGN